MSDLRVKKPIFLTSPPKQEDISTVLSIQVPLLFLAAALLLWVVSWSKVDLKQMNDLGLVSILPLTFFAALIILTNSFLLILNWNVPNEVIMLFHVLALIFILHGTPQILYGTLRYSWAWKHVGIVDYIQRHGSVDPTITDLNAYHNWPGFFALSAFYNGVAGLESSLSYAGWGPVFFNILDLGVLLLVFKIFTNDRRLVWLGVWFFYLTSWVGQDYFSPQAMSYFLYLVAIAIVLIWFRVYAVSFRIEAIPMLRNRWIAKLYQTVVNRAIPEKSQWIRTDARQRIGIMAILIMLFAVIASSHQLTPLIAVMALSALVIFQICSQRYLPVLMAVITVTWVLFMAVGFLNSNLYWVVKSFGSLFRNVNSNLIDLAVASPGQQFVAFMDRGLSASIWVLGIFGFVRRYRSGHWDLPAVLLAASPLPMLALNAYGGEMLFRVYLFSLPFVAFFAASLLYPDLRAGTTLKTTLFATLLSFSLLLGFLFAYYGKERTYYFSPNEVAAAQYVYTTAPRGSLLLDGTWDWPRQSTHYEDYNYVSIANLSTEEKQKIVNDPIDVVSRLMDDASPGSVNVDHVAPEGQQDKDILLPGGIDDDDYPAAYFVITRSQIAETEMTGILPADSLNKITYALIGSGRFQVVFVNSDAIVLKLTNPVEEK